MSLVRSENRRTSRRLNFIFSGSVYPEAVGGGGHGSVCYHKDMVAACEVDVEQETNKMAVVVLTKAVVHPWTVMI